MFKTVIALLPQNSATVFRE